MKPQYLVVLALFLLATAASAGPFDNGVERMSVSSSGAEGDFLSDHPGISADGRFVVFSSDATNLVPGDTNDRADVFVHDRQTGTTTRVSRSSGGAQANNLSFYPVISAAGRYVAFMSLASNLVAGDTNNVADVFLHDRVTGFTTRVSVATSGAQADDFSTRPAISGDGQFVVFVSRATNLHVLGNGNRSQVYVRDVAANRTTLCSVGAFLVPGNESSFDPQVSFDGSRIVFGSSATNLVTADNPATQDLYLYELATGLIGQVNRGYNGALPDNHGWEPVISADGKFVAFRSTASNLIAGGTLGGSQIYLYDIANDSNAIVSVHTNGNYGNGHSSFPSISSDGKRIAFDSQSTNLVPGDTSALNNVYIHDVTTGTTACMTRLADGLQGGGTEAALAAEGDFLAFSSDAVGYVTGDDNGRQDVFVRDYGALSRNAGSNPASFVSSRPVLGEEWRASVDVTTTGHTSAVLYGKLATLSAPLGGGQVLLIGGQTIFKLPAQSGPVASWAAPLPNDLGLVGQKLYTQALHLFGVTPFALSNGQDLCLGY